MMKNEEKSQKSHQSLKKTNQDFPKKDTQEIQQISLGFWEEKKHPPAKPQPPKKPHFIPPTLDNGLSPSIVSDCAMMWLRMLGKQSVTDPAAYLNHHMTEIQFKRTAYDQTVVTRDALLRSAFLKNKF